MAPSEVLSRGSSLSSMGKKGEIGGEGRHPIWGREGDILFLVTINLSLRMYWRGMEGSGDDHRRCGAALAWLENRRKTGFIIFIFNTVGELVFLLSCVWAFLVSLWLILPYTNFIYLLIFI